MAMRPEGNAATSLFFILPFLEIDGGLKGVGEAGDAFEEELGGGVLSGDSGRNVFRMYVSLLSRPVRRNSAFPEVCLLDAPRLSAAAHF